jgi:hypothetical protein
MISINLLPPELVASKQAQQRKKLVNQISAAVIGVVILLTILGIGYGRYQINNLAKANNALTTSRAQLDAYKDRESLLFVVKTLVDGVNYTAQKDYNQVTAYGLISSFLPADARLLNFSIDKTSLVNLSVEASSSASLQSLFDQLANPSSNQGNITKINIDSLSQSSNNNLRFDMHFMISNLK